MLRSGMGPTISEFIKELKKKEEGKPEGDKRDFAEDDIQMACM